MFSSIRQLLTLPALRALRACAPLGAPHCQPSMAPAARCARQGCAIQLGPARGWVCSRCAGLQGRQQGRGGGRAAAAWSKMRAPPTNAEHAAVLCAALPGPVRSSRQPAAGNRSSSRSSSMCGCVYRAASSARRHGSTQQAARQCATASRQRPAPQRAHTLPAGWRQDCTRLAGQACACASPSCSGRCADAFHHGRFLLRCAA